MTLRSRLTLLIGSIIALALLSFSGILYVVLDRTTLSIARAALATEAMQILKEERFTLTRIVEPPQKIGMPAMYVQTLDVYGIPLARSTNLMSFDIPLSTTGLAAVQSGAPWFEVVPKGNISLLVYSKPVRNGTAVIGAIQIASSLANRDDVMASLRALLGAGSLVTLLAAALLGWLIAGAALGPIGRMTRTAASIGAAHDFTKRLPVPRARDEVGVLSTTLNSMLAELECAHKQVTQSLVDQRRFVADASHELRTPLTSIRGFLSLLDRKPPISRTDARTALAATIAETDRVIRLVNQLFVLARTDAGQIRYELAPVPIAPLIETLAEQIGGRIANRTLTVQVDRYLIALGNADAIMQVLLNLIENALTHTPPLSQIALTATADDGRAIITVADAGPGIAAEYLPHLFKRFYQIHPSRTGNGAGLGLAIAHALAEAQGGALSVESAPGQGSRFMLSLPLHPLSAAA